jgi:uncharacterized protein YjhX (UPF0386 family)
MKKALFWVCALCAMGFAACDKCYEECCQGSVCHNRGACSDRACFCTAGYVGVQCDTAILQHLAGKYVGIAHTPVHDTVVTWEIARINDARASVAVTGNGLAFYLTVNDGEDFVIPTQSTPINGALTTLAGGGKMWFVRRKQDSIAYTMTYTANGVMQTASGKLGKQ